MSTPYVSNHQQIDAVLVYWVLGNCGTFTCVWFSFNYSVFDVNYKSEYFLQNQDFNVGTERSRLSHLIAISSFVYCLSRTCHKMAVKDVPVSSHTSESPNWIYGLGQDTATSFTRMSQSVYWKPSLVSVLSHETAELIGHLSPAIWPR